MYRDPIRKLVAEAFSEHKDRVLKEPEFIAPKPRGKHRRLTEAQKKERERARQERAAKRFEKKYDRYLDSLIRQSREEERKAIDVVEVDDVEFLLSPSGTPLVGDVLNISRRAKDLDDAKRIAVRSLRNANRNEVTLHLEAAGDIALRAGLNIEVVGAGDFSGKYHIDGAHQSVRGAFHTSVDGHKVLAY